MSDSALSPQQREVISALSSGVSVTDAAQQAGIHRNTINHWRRNHLHFRHALADAQYDRTLYYREKVEQLADAAIQTLQQLLDDPKTPPSVRLKAALTVIQLATTPPPPKPQVQLVYEPLSLTQLTQQPPAEPEPGPEPIPFQHTNPDKTGRNELCPCGSGQKYKRCCLNKPKTQAA